MAVVHAANRRLQCIAVNLSNNGMLLIPPARAGAGLEMQLNFTFPGMDEWVTVKAVLVREGRYRNRYAWGIKFTEVAPYASTLIRSYVRKVARGEITEPQMSAKAKPLFGDGTTGPQKPAAGKLQPVETGPYAAAKRQSSPRVAASASRPTIAEDELPETSAEYDDVPEDYDPFADLPPAGGGSSEDLEDVHETHPVEVSDEELEDIDFVAAGSVEDQRHRLWAKDAKLNRLYRAALADLQRTAGGGKKKKSLFGGKKDKE